METNGINGPSATAYQLEDIGEYTEPTPLSSGSPEELIAQVAVRLEEAGARDADVSRQMRRSRTRENRAALDDKRKAAKLQLAAGITQSAASAVQGAVSLGQASQNLQASNATIDAKQLEATGESELALVSQRDAAAHSASSERMGGASSLVGAGGEGTAATMRYFGERASIEAARHENEAEVLSESAQASDEARESAQRFADKAMQHMAEIEEAKHRAAMAALRG